MKQKLEDLKILLQRDRKAQLIAVVVLLCIIYLLFADGRSGIQTAEYIPPEEEINQGSGAMGAEEAPNDIVRAFSSDLKKLEEQNTETVKALDETRKSMENYEAKTAEIFKRVLERLSETEAAVQRGSTAAGATEPVNMVDDGGMAEDDDVDTLESFGNEAPAVAPPPPTDPKKMAVIGAGDSVRVKLLAGVNAPTDNTPYPVVFKLISDVYGPDGSTLPLGEARLVAAAQGSLTDSRVLYRITALNIRLPNGKRKFVDVDGWVVGEDGIRGMEGLLIDPIGKAIVAGGLTGGLAGLGDAVSDSQTTDYDSYYGSTEVVTGDDTKYAAGQAISGAAREWGDIVRDRVEQLVPHVQVLSGREATAVFAKSITIPELFETFEEEENVFSSLD